MKRSRRATAFYQTTATLWERLGDPAAALLEQAEDPTDKEADFNEKMDSLESVEKQFDEDEEEDAESFLDDELRWRNAEDRYWDRSQARCVQRSHLRFGGARRS